MTSLCRVIPLLMLVSLTGCVNDVQDVTTSAVADGLPTCTMKWGSSYVWTPDMYDRIAAYPVFNYQCFSVFDDPYFDAGELIARDPDIEIGCYVQAHSVAKWQLDTLDRAESFARDWAEMGLRHLAYTTEGDTFSSYISNYMITTNDPATVDDMVGVIAKWVDSSPNRDHLASMFWMLDYCSAGPQPPGAWDERPDVHGELDLDGDGVGYAEDPDEREALRQGYFLLVRRLRETFPEVKILSNGVMPYDDPEFAAELDGVYLEGAFQWGFPGQVRDGLATDGDRSFANILARFRPGGFSILESTYPSRYILAEAMMFDGVYATIKPTGNRFEYSDESFASWSAVGAPLGPKSVGDGTVTRDFVNGRAEITFTDGLYPEPFKFRLVDHRGNVLADF